MVVVVGGTVVVVVGGSVVMVVVWGTVVVAGGATVVAASAGCCVLVEIGARLVRTLGVVRAVVVVVVAIGSCGAAAVSSSGRNAWVRPYAPTTARRTIPIILRSRPPSRETRRLNEGAVVSPRSTWGRSASTIERCCGTGPLSAALAPWLPRPPMAGGNFAPPAAGGPSTVGRSRGAGSLRKRGSCSVASDSGSPGAAEAGCFSAPAHDRSWS